MLILLPHLVLMELSSPFLKIQKSTDTSFLASMLAKLGLAIPLLLQQIIDKVLSQGNLSSLNVLGTAMLVMALFQGFLPLCVLTYLST